MTNIAIIFAGGESTRFLNKTPKQFYKVNGKELIIHTLENFEKHPLIDKIYVAILKAYHKKFEKMISKAGLKKIACIVDGGASGQESIFNALKRAYEENAPDSLVLIHDGVRPLINEKLINDCIDSVEKYGSAITSVVVKETVLMVKDSDTDEIDYIPNRANTRLARAPQCFWLDQILEAEEEEVAKGNINFIDSCSLMQSKGLKMHLVDGPMENIKVTTPDDFYSMRALLDAKENEQIYGD